jgi:hypothetical protein
MALNPVRGGVPFMSTGVVAHALELDPKAMRAMIEIGTLPAPQWINLGRRRERVYSLEWLLLASEQLNARRLPGLESEPRQDQFVQFVLRFEQTDWGVDEVAQKLHAINNLWELCARTFVSESGEVAPPLKVRRLSAGSPLDLLGTRSSSPGSATSDRAASRRQVAVLADPVQLDPVGSSGQHAVDVRGGATGRTRMTVAMPTA